MQGLMILYAVTALASFIVSILRDVIDSLHQATTAGKNSDLRMDTYW